MGAGERTIRYVRSWVTGRSDVREADLVAERPAGPARVRLLLPSWPPPPWPAWILLHGVTRPGLDHPQLVRFARALASSGAAVLLPEVSEWKELRLAPEAALDAVASAVRVLRGVPEVTGERHGLIGFSFGGPQALLTASHEEVAGALAGVVSFGGYCDLERTVRFQFTGEHEWEGHLLRARPDPYGRWVVGANFLTAAPGYGDAGDVARALWELAAYAGETRAPAWSPAYDGLKARLRARLAAPRRELFDAFAATTAHDPTTGHVEALVRALVAGGRRIAPLMEPEPFLGRVGHPVELLHGKGDRLIPYSESHRLARSLPRGADSHVTVTGLFAHSTGERLPLLGAAPEAWTFLRTLGRIVTMV